MDPYSAVAIGSAASGAQGPTALHGLEWVYGLSALEMKNYMF